MSDSLGYPPLQPESDYYAVAYCIRKLYNKYKQTLPEDFAADLNKLADDLARFEAIKDKSRRRNDPEPRRNDPEPRELPV